MDHERATATKLPMKYVLGELAPADRDEFEDHLADCSNCMNEVWMATAFAANAKEVFREEAAEPAPAPRRKWFPWSPFPAFAFSAALNIALAAGLGYGVLRVYPGMRAELAEWNQAAAVDVVPVRGVERAATGSVQTVKTSGNLVVLSFDLPQRYEKYVYSIAEPTRGVVLSGEINYKGTDSLHLRVPAGRLAPGKYKVTVAGLNGSHREDLGACLLQVEAK